MNNVFVSSIGTSRRLLVGRSEIAENEAVRFMRRIGAVTQLVIQRAVSRLPRGFQDRAVDVEQPPMIAAAYPLRADEAEFERGAAMRAVQFQQTDRAALIAERDQILTQDPDPQREVAELIGETHRLPEAAHVFATRRIRPDMAEFCIRTRAIEGVLAAQRSCEP